MKSKLCGFRGKKCEGRAVSRERGPGTGGPARDGEPAWSGSRTEVCGAARRARRGEEMTSQKGVVTAPARAPEPSPVEGRRGGQSWEGGRTRRLPGPGKPRGREARPPLPAARRGPVAATPSLPQAPLPSPEGGGQTRLPEARGTRAPRGEGSRPEGRSAGSARTGFSVRPERPGGNGRAERTRGEAHS